MGKFSIIKWKACVILNILLWTLFFSTSCINSWENLKPQRAIATNAADWIPKLGQRLQIQYTNYPIDLSVDADIFAVDLFEISRVSIDELHMAGKKVICYLNTGSWEEYRPDAGDFAAEIIGKEYVGWPGERWLDISRYELFAEIMEKRFDLALQKGCDGIDADNMQNFEEDTGFNITFQDQLVYNLWLGSQAHQRGLSIGLKNDPEQVNELASHFDWSLVEDCADYQWCDLLLPFTRADKPVFQVEYTELYAFNEYICPVSEKNGFSGLLKNRELDAWVEYCP
jgi:hypothetical protein